jgi:hypothetical protein
MASADQARDHASARATPEPNVLARRLFMPTLAVAVLLIVLAGLAAWGGSDGELGRALAPVIVLLALGLVGLLFTCMAKVKSTALMPVSRLQTALRRVPDQGVAAVSGLRDPGVLGGVVREVSALLEAYLPSAQDDAKARETAVRGRLETVLRDLHDGVLICTLTIRCFSTIAARWKSCTSPAMSALTGPCLRHWPTDRFNMPFCAFKLDLALAVTPSMPMA